MARIMETVVDTTETKPTPPPMGCGCCGSGGGGGGGGGGGSATSGDPTSGGKGQAATGCEKDKCECKDDKSEPNCSACGSQKTDKPIRYQTGGHQMPVNDLSSGGLGLTWGHTRVYNNRLGATGQVNENFGNGNNWMVRQWAYIVDPLGDDSEIVAVFSPGEAYWFLEDEEQAGEYHGQYGALHTLEHDTDGKVFKLTQPDGTIWEFYDFTQIWMSRPQGALSKVTTPGGQVLQMTYNLLGQLTTAQRTTGSGAGYIADTFEYTYIGGGGGGMQMLVATNDGNLERVTHKRKVGSSAAVNIRKVEYTYYGESEDYGLLDDLKTAKQWIWDGAAWRAEGTEYYRYYTETFADEAGRRGFEHALRFIVGSQAYSEITTPESASDSAIAAKADYFFEYDSSRRVITERLGGDGTDSREWTFGYEDRDGEFTEGYNVWSHKTTETRPDDSMNTVFTNYLGQVILKELDDGSNTWATHFQYGEDANAYETARVLLRAEPSAVSGWSVDGTTKVLTVSLNPSEGLIHTYSYYAATSGSVSATVAGGVEGYLEYEKVKKGTGATAEALRKLEYKERADSGVTIYLIGKETVYKTGSAGGTDPIFTEYHYDSWHGTHVKERRTTLPSISSGQHGPDSAAERLELFDKFGNRLAEQDERGFITTYEYDEGKGVLMKTIVDDDVPSGTSWTANSGTRLKLTTDFESDDQGRITQVLGPNHDIDGTDVRTANWTVYKDADREVWTTEGYDDGTAKATDPKAPVTITKLNKENQPLEIIVAERYGTGRLLATETYTDQTEWARWTKHEYNETGEVNKTQVYFNIPDSGSGTLNTHYDQTEFAYDKLGNPDWVKSPGGTITRTTFDARSLATKVEVGTDDSGTGSDTMKEVTTNIYDANGNLTKQTQHVDGNSANDRVTDYVYDYRNRLEKIIGEESFFQKNTYDNLNRMTQVDLHDGDGGGGQPGGTLIGSTVTAYDDRGRVYKTTRYAVDDQGDTGNTLVDKSWYDAAGNMIKSHPAGSEAFIKTEYDSAGRAITAYVGFDADESSHADADDVAGDTIFEQTETTYDKASNATFFIRRRRFDNEVDTNTGELGDAAGTGDKPKARVTHMATWYDEIGRQTATANYGDNGNVEMDPSTTDRPDSPPSSTETRLVSTIGYNDRGEAENQTDPAGIVTRSVYDDDGRVVEKLQNYVASPSNPDENVTVTTEYDADGHVKKLTAVNSETGDQVTEYVYGVTLTNSEIETYDLLQKVIYPRGAATDTVTYEYNRQGERIEMTDQNGTVHEYTYDGRGRQIEDIVTTFGGVDETVKRIDHAYNVRGLLEKVTSYSNTAGTTVVNDVQFAYDDDKFDALMIEYQEHDTTVNTSTSPKVQYDYVGGSDDGGDTNNNNRRTKVTYPNSRILEYTYNTGADDSLSRVSQFEFGTTGSTTTVAEYTYLGMGDFVTVNYPEPSSFDIHYNLATGSGSSRYAGLDRFDRIVELLWKEHNGATADLVKIKHGYDKASNRTYREDVAADGQSVDLDELYVYDGLHRLTAFDRGELTVGSPPTITPNFTQHWTLETTGNWEQFQQDDNGGTTWDLDQDRDHNKANEITAIAASSTHVAHDNNGNMTKVPKPSSWSAHYELTYDAWNRLVKVEDGETTVADYEYDGLNRRIEKTVDSVTRDFYYSDDWQVLEEQVSGSPERQFVWGVRYVDDLVLRDRDDTGDLDERLYALQDANWNVVALTDTAGAVQERYAYDAYGKSLVRNADFTDNATGTDYDWEYRFTGRRLDDETGLQLNRNRFYHQSLGRWVTRDPIGYAGNEWSLYGYGRNAPVEYVDSTGLTVVPFGIDFGSKTTGVVYGGLDGNWVYDCTKETSDVDLVPGLTGIHSLGFRFGKVPLGIALDALPSNLSGTEPCCSGGKSGTEYVVHLKVTLVITVGVVLSDSWTVGPPLEFEHSCGCKVGKNALPCPDKDPPPPNDYPPLPQILD